MITVHIRNMQTRENGLVDVNIDHIINYEDGIIITTCGTLLVEETREQIADMIYAARCTRYEAFAHELRNMGVGV